MRGAKISLVIPHYPTPVTDVALNGCLQSFKGHYDELLLEVNEATGYGPAVNQGLKKATGDYIIVSNNDIMLLSGSLRDLPSLKGITVPLIEPTPRDYQPRSIFCMPKWVYIRLSSCGYFFDPRFKTGYFEDDDLIRRLGDIKVFVQGKVKVNHLDGGGLTMKQMGEQKWFDINQEVFKNKWS